MCQQTIRGEILRTTTNTPLPDFRLSDNPPFTYVRLDFVGPLTLIGLGFLTSLGWGGGGGAAPSLSSLFVALWQQNFVQGLTIKALAQIWKKLHKVNDVIDNDVIKVRKLAERAVTRA